MSGFSDDLAFPRSGTMVCHFAVKVGFPGKRPFFVGTFHTPRYATQMETEAAARRIAVTSVRYFMDQCFPDDSRCPEVIDVSLGSITFVPDDFEWRRT